jgi:hypothetical protein
MPPMVKSGEESAAKSQFSFQTGMGFAMQGHHAQVSTVGHVGDMGDSGRHGGR